MRKLLKPVIIIGCNRSGTTLLLRNLASHPRMWSIYTESRQLFFDRFPRHPEHGDRVTDPPSEVVRRSIIDELYELAHNREYFKDTGILRLVPRKLLQRPLSKQYKSPPIRLVEKTPSNCFRVPLLSELFPDAKFVFLVRRGEAVVSSLMEGWKIWSGCENGEWSYTKWHYLAPPGWREMRKKSLAEICAFQWRESNLTAWRDLNEYCPDRHILVRHEESLSRRHEQYNRILDFCELPESEYVRSLLDKLEEREFTEGGSSPSRGKWRRLHGEEVESVRGVIEPVNELFYGESDNYRDSGKGGIVGR